MAKDFADISRLELAQDRAAAKRESVSKLMQAWESKNAKRALQGAGLSTMAVTLAACGGSSTTTTTTTPVTPAPVTPVSASLTIGVDAVVGTSGGDTISGARADDLQTWNSTDTIAAGAGTDTLTADIAATVTPVANGVTGVENLVVTARADVDVDFSSATETFIVGVTSITNIASTNQLDFLDIPSLATLNVTNTGQVTTFEFNDAVLAGAADTVTLNVNGATGRILVGTNGDADGDFETLTVVANGAASTIDARDLDGDVTTVNVSGSADLSFGANAAFANVGTFSAGAATGDITVVFAADGVTGTTNAKSITTGSGDDSITISAIDNATVGAVSVTAGAGDDTVDVGARLASDYTINGGAGTDTLIVTAALDAVAMAGVSGFETLVTSAAANMALVPAGNAFTTVEVRDASAITNATGITTLRINAATANNDAISLAQQIDGTADAITITTVAAAADLLAEAITITANDAETVTINSAAAALVIASADAVADLSITDATSLVVTGDNDVNLGDVAAAALVTVDLTGLVDTDSAAGDTTDEGDFVARFNSTADMVVTANSSTTHTGIINVTTFTGADTVTGTVNNDTITTQAGNDTVNGGAGDDTINGGAGNDTLNGDAGNDTIDGGIGVDTINGGAGNDIITGGQGNDALTGGAGVDTFKFTDATAQDNDNGSDTILDFVAGADGDKLNFGTILGTLATGATNATDIGAKIQGGSAADAITATATGVDIDGKVAMFKGDADTATEVAALFASADNGDNKYFELSASADGSEEAIVITGEDGSSTVYVWLVTNTANEPVVAAEVSLLSTITLTNGDIDDLTVDNFTFLA